jgi:pimeloyl-ACP methyl ester carboxylesterase
VRDDLPVTDVGDGPALLCLHGGPGLSDYLTDLGDETAGWRRVSYTQRGLAPSTTDGPFSVDQHVADAVTVLDGLGLDEAVVLGHSWGGFLAAALAAQHPGRVRGLLLVDPLGVVGDGGFGRFSEQMLARTPDGARRRADELDQRAMAGEGTEDDVVESLNILWPAYFADRDHVMEMPEMHASIPAYSGLWDSLRAELPGLGPALESVSVPTTVLAGDSSPMPIAVSEAVAEAIRGATFTAAEGAGHFPWFERPGSVRAALADLVAR